MGLPRLRAWLAEHRTEILAMLGGAALVILVLLAVLR